MQTRADGKGAAWPVIAIGAGSVEGAAAGTNTCTLVDRGEGRARDWGNAACVPGECSGDRLWSTSDSNNAQHRNLLN